jgi:nucleotide-binding universal stress UspA family protein
MYDQNFGKILVTLDGTEFSESILDQIEELANKYDSEVVLLTVKPRPMAQAILGEFVSTVDQEAEAEYLQADAYLREVVGRLALRDIKASGEVLFGDPAYEIAEYAKSHSIGLIAMASHQRYGLDRLLHGSVSHKVVTSVHQPVLLYTPHVAKAA